MKNFTIILIIFNLLLGCLISISYSETHSAIISYDKYLDAINNAHSLDDLDPFISKRKIEVYGAMSEDKRKSTLTFKKGTAKFMERKGIKAQSEGISATLTVDIIDKSTDIPATVIVSLVNEGGEWKVDKEKYKF